MRMPIFGILALYVQLSATKHTQFHSRECSAAAAAVGVMRSIGCGDAERRSDKVDESGYQLMYGMHLMPLADAPAPKLLEIGLGCNGPGRSARLWRALLPRAEIWEADLDERCVEAHSTRMRQLNISVLAGSQGDAATVQRWLADAGGAFDAIIDDGSHRPQDVYTAFSDCCGRPSSRAASTSSRTSAR